MNNGMSKWNVIALSALVGLAAILVVGCDKGKQDKPAAPGKPAPGAAADLPAGLFVEKEPANAVEVGKALADAQDGQSVVVVGRIAGRKEPFVPGRAAMVIADLSLPACNERPGDNCPEPWDLCCEPAEVLAAKTVVVEIAGADGRTLKTGLEGVKGLKPLAKVTIEGTVKKSPDGKSVSLVAKTIFVKA